jgi:hypothetical protein
MPILTEKKLWRRGDLPDTERKRRVLSQEERANVRHAVEYLRVGVS